MTPEDRVAEVRGVRLEEDTETLLRLFELCFHRPVSRESWLWKYRPPWSQGTYGAVALVEGRIVGHVGAVNLRASIGGRDVPFFLVGDIMVHPYFRALAGTAERMWRTVLEIVRSEHARVIFYGFTDRRRVRLYERVGLATATEDVVECVVRAPSPAEQGPADLSIEPWDWEESPVDRLRPQQADGRRAGIVRDRAFLHWRYARRPTHGYQLFGVRSEGQPIGWFVTQDRTRLPDPAEEIRVLDVRIPEPLMLPALHLGMERLRARAFVLWGAARGPTAGVERRVCGWVRMMQSEPPSEGLSLDDVDFTLGEADEWWW